MPIWNTRQLAFLSLGLAVLVGLLLRLLQLDEQTFTHPEFYVPALSLPDFVTTPRPRFTVPEILQESLINDKHPPGYNILMLAWNLNVGTQVFQIRLSSVLFGMLGILAIPWYVRVNGGSGFGLLAAWLVALHGFHVYWSQQARPWVLIGTFGIVTTALLVSLVRRPRIAAMIGYGLLAGYGMWIDYYFWPIVAAQVLWLVLHELDRDRMPLAFGAIALAAIIAAPMAIYFWLHLSGQESHLPRVSWNDVLRVLQFGTVVPRTMLRKNVPGLAVPFEVLATVLAVVTIALGLRGWPSVQRDEAESPRSRSGAILAILAVFAVVVSAWTWSAFRELVGDRKVFPAAVIWPFIALAGWSLLNVLWPSLAPRIVALRIIRWFRSFLADPVTVIPIVAFGSVLVLARLRPMFAWYAMVCFTPFIVVIAARGIQRMGRWKAPVGAAVTAIFVASAWLYGTRPFSPIEYKGLALQLIERVTPGQVIVMRNWWATAPFTYYLTPDITRIVPISVYPPATPPLQVELPDTLWLVATGDDDAMLDEELTDIRRFVPGFSPVERISTGSSAALCMVRPGG